MTASAAPPARTVSVVGGGASGTLTAVNLLRLGGDDLRVVLHDRGPATGRGLAYGTPDRRHLLNVRSRDMSGLADEPGHLLAWAERTGRDVDPVGFLPRATYGDYLVELLAEMDAAHPGRLEVRREEVLDVEPTASPGRPGTAPYDVHGSAGVTRADEVVLAWGNLPAAPLSVAGEPLDDAPWHLPSAWDSQALESLPVDGTVVLVGSGLTAVDAAITLLGSSPTRRVLMVSRGGRLPRTHLTEPCSTRWVRPVPEGLCTADALAAHVAGEVDRAASSGVCWRSVVDGLRGSTQRLWGRLDRTERRRFVEVHARAWDTHRHRMAPQVAATIRGHVDAGRLRVVAGGLSRVVDAGARASVTLADGEIVAADAVVNCTGPCADLDRTEQPLPVAVRERGLLTRDPLGLGVHCRPDGAVLGADGVAREGLHVVGPLRKGALWESTAVPEIRAQAAALAERLTAGARDAATAAGHNDRHERDRRGDPVARVR